MPFLDLEFQKVSFIPDHLVNDYTLLSLLIAEHVIASPSFFLESPITLKTMVTSTEFFGTSHIYLSMRDETLSDFLARKQSEYVGLETSFSGYYVRAQEISMLDHITSRKRHRKIGMSIKTDWLSSLNSEEPLSLVNVVRSFKVVESGTVIDALKKIPDIMGEKPFVWQHVEAALTTLIPHSRLPQSLLNQLRCYLIKCYFENLADSEDHLVSFSDFPMLSIADEGIRVPTLPLNPLREFLMRSGAMNKIRSLNALQFIQLINSPACKDFRIYYNKTISTLRENSLEKEKSLASGFSYFIAVRWYRVLVDSITEVFSQVAGSLSGIASKRSLQDMLDIAGCKFLKSVDQILEMDLKWRTRLLKSTLTGERPMFTIGRMENYIVGNAGIVGPNASMNTVNQNTSQSSFQCDILKLAEELSNLRIALKAIAVSPEHDIAVGAVAAAELQARTGEVSKVWEHLKNAGLWSLAQATQIGVHTASAAIKHALEL